MEYMNEQIFSFERLQAYQTSRCLVKSVYDIIRALPNDERFALGSQIKRAIVSVTSNIAEGCGRVSYKEKIHFLEIAYGSLLEAYSQLQLGVDLDYISPKLFYDVKPQFTSVARLLNALRRSYIEKIQSDKHP